MDFKEALNRKELSITDLKNALINNNNINTIKSMLNSNNFASLPFETVKDISFILDIDVYELLGFEDENEFKMRNNKKAFERVLKQYIKNLNKDLNNNECLFNDTSNLNSTINKDLVGLLKNISGYYENDALKSPFLVRYTLKPRRNRDMELQELRKNSRKITKRNRKSNQNSANNANNNVTSSQNLENSANNYKNIANSSGDNIQNSAKKNAINNLDLNNNIAALQNILNNLGLDNTAMNEIINSVSDQIPYETSFNNPDSISYNLEHLPNIRPYKAKRGKSDEAIATYFQDGDSWVFRITVCFTSDNGVFLGGLTWVAEETDKEIHFYKGYVFDDDINILTHFNDKSNLEEIDRVQFLIETNNSLAY